MDTRWIHEEETQHRLRLFILLSCQWAHSISNYPQLRVHHWIPCSQQASNLISFSLTTPFRVRTEQVCTWQTWASKLALRNKWAQEEFHFQQVHQSDIKDLSSLFIHHSTKKCSSRHSFLNKIPKQCTIKRWAKTTLNTQSSLIHSHSEDHPSME